MADLGRLRWVLTADTRQLDGALRRTARGFQRLGAIAAAGFSLRGAGNFMRGAVDAADNMQKTADAAGVLVEELQQLRFVADLAGVEQRQFDDAIQRFALRLGKAQLGFGPLLETLKREFDTVHHVKPDASRSDSSELYVLAQGFRGRD